MPRYTDAQVDRARHADLERFLHFRSEKLVRSGSEWRWVYRDGSGEHDSVTVKGSEWYDHKREIGGDAIGFLQEFMDMDFKEAVSVLLDGETGSVLRQKDSAPAVQPKVFTLPDRNPNMHRMYAYLTKTRFLCADVITHFVRAGSLYEDCRHNAVFLGLDESDVARAGQKKGTLTIGASYRKTIYGSDSRYGFHHRGTSSRLNIYEAPIDMLSYISMHMQDWQQHSYIALDGLSSKAMHHFLSWNPQVGEVYLCLDNDPAGIEAVDKFRDELQENGYADVKRLTSIQKDWNEDLKARNSVAAISAQKHPKIEGYHDAISRLRAADSISYAQFATEHSITSTVSNIKRGLDPLDGDPAYWDRHLFRTATLCTLVARHLGGGDILHQLACDYKPYTDKGKLRTHVDELHQCAILLGRTKDVPALTALADACIRAYVYIQTDYAVDLERQAIFSHDREISDAQPEMCLSL